MNTQQGSAPATLTRDEYLLLLQTAKLMGKQRAYLLVKTIVNIGVKTQELSGVTVEALREGMVCVTSYRIQRRVPVSEPIGAELLAYAEQEGISSGPVFVTKHGTAMLHSAVWKEIKQVCRHTGIPEEKVMPKELYRLYLSTYRSICDNSVQEIAQAYRRLLEAEEEAIAWNK